MSLSAEENAYQQLELDQGPEATEAEIKKVIAGAKCSTAVA